MSSIKLIAPVNHLTHVAVSAYRAATDNTVQFRSWIRPVIGVAVIAEPDGRESMAFVIQSHEGTPILYRDRDRSRRSRHPTCHAIVESHPDRIEYKVERLQNAALDRLLEREERSTEIRPEEPRESTLANRVRMRVRGEGNKAR